MQDAPVNSHAEENGAEEIEEKQRIRVVSRNAAIAPGSGGADVLYSCPDLRTRLLHSNSRTRITPWAMPCATSS